MSARFATAAARLVLVLVMSLIASSARATEFRSREPMVFTPGTGARPADIVSSGLSGVITKVKVTLYDVNIPDPSLFSAVISSGDGSDWFALIDLFELDGSYVPVSADHVTITFDDFSTKRLNTNLPLTSGTFQRTWFWEFRHSNDAWIPFFLEFFAGGNPNRTWHLDLATNGNGSIGGWSVDIETAAPFGDPQTFTSSSGLTISDSTQNASPYPLTLDVAGLDGLVVYDASVTVSDVTVPDAMAIHMLVQTPDTRPAMVYSNNGGICSSRTTCTAGAPANDVTLTFSDAPAPLPPGSNWPFGPLVSGTYQPFDVDPDPNGGAPFDFFPAPAFSGGKFGSMRPLWGGLANGSWKLFVHDQTLTGAGLPGSISQWSVTIQPGLPEPLALDSMPDIVTTNTPGLCTAPITFDLPFAKGSPTPTVTAVPASGTLFSAGVTPVTITAANIFGSVTQTFNVTVNDIEAPTMPPPADIVVNNDANPLGTVVNFSLQTLDNCSGLTVTANPPSGSYFPLGTTVVTAFATDPAGNKSNVVQFTVTVEDHTAPVISYQSSPAISTSWLDAVVSLNITATDFGGSGVASLVCLGTSPALSGIASVSATISAEGETTITCTATDVAGNQSVLTLPTIRIDREPPQIVVTRSVPPNANGWNNTDVAVHFAVSDAGSGIAQAGNPDAVFTAERAGQGVIFFALDKAGHCAVVVLGNNGSSSCPVFTRLPAVNIDKTPPAVTIQQTPPPNANGWNNADVTVHVAATDTVSGVNGPTTSDDAFTVDGQYPGKTLTFTDFAGNSTTVTTPAIMLDKTPPQIVDIQQIPPPNANGWNNTPVTLMANVIEQGSTPSAASFNQVINTEGMVDIPFTVTDLAGNSATHVFHVSTDWTPPTITAERSGSPNANGWDQQVFITYKGTDSGSGFGSPCCFGQQGSTVTVQQLTFTTEGRGVVATSPAFTDRAGNVGVPASLTLNIDRTPPVVNMSRFPLGNQYGWNNTDVTVHFDASDAVSGLTGPATEDVVFSNDGVFTVQRTYTDLAGNSTSKFMQGILIDKTPPVVQASYSPGPNANGWSNFFVTVRFDVLDNGGSGAVTPVVFVPLTQQGVNLGATQTFSDRAGNTAVGSIVGINVDTMPPQVTAVLTPPANQYGWNSTDVQVQFLASDALSGVAGSASSAPQLVTTTGRTELRQSFFDNAGNRGDGIVAVSIDKTPPNLYCYTNPFLTPGSGLVPASVYVYLDDGDNSDSSGGPAYIHLMSVTSSRPQPGDIVDWAVGTEDYAGLLLAPPGPESTVYTLTYEGSDFAGNKGTCSATITVAYAPTHIAGIAPASAVAGTAANLDLVITGDGFVDGATVHWNSIALPSTIVSANEIHATVPAAMLASPGSVVVTVETPQPSGGAPGPGLFLITLSPVSVTSIVTGQAGPENPGVFIQAGATPDGQPDTIFVTANNGVGTVAAATYSGNPGVSFAGGSNFFDVFVSPGATFESVSIVTCAVGASTQVFWASHDGWRLASNQTYYPGDGVNPACIQVDVSQTGTFPTIADLAGTYFAPGADITPPVLTLPAPMSVEASGPNGATVAYVVSAKDDTDPAPTVTCAPPSGGLFPIGTTTVACTATDATGHLTTGTFTVTVTQPAALDGRMHGDGFVRDGPAKHHFEFEVATRGARDGDRDDERFEYTITAPKQGRTPERDDRFAATSIDAVAFADDPASSPGPKKNPPKADSVAFSGRGRWNGKSGYTFQVQAVDRGEPGIGRDTFAVTVTDAAGKVVAEVSGVLAGGNVQSARVAPGR